MSYDCDVLIAGGGPTGVTLAVLLARRGVNVIVAEKEAGVFPLPRAAHIDLTVLCDRFGPAFRTMIRKLECRPGRAARQILHNLGNHIARALHQNPVTRPDPKANNFVAIVQRDVRDDNTAHCDGLKPSHGG